MVARVVICHNEPPEKIFKHALLSKNQAIVFLICLLKANLHNHEAMNFASFTPAQQKGALVILAILIVILAYRAC